MSSLALNPETRGLAVTESVTIFTTMQTQALNARTLSHRSLRALSAEISTTTKQSTLHTGRSLRHSPSLTQALGNHVIKIIPWEPPKRGRNFTKVQISRTKRALFTKIPARSRLRQVIFPTLQVSGKAALHHLVASLRAWDPRKRTRRAHLREHTKSGPSSRPAFVSA